FEISRIGLIYDIKSFPTSSYSSGIGIHLKHYIPIFSTISLGNWSCSIAGTYVLISRLADHSTHARISSCSLFSVSSFSSLPSLKFHKSKILYQTFYHTNLPDRTSEAKDMDDIY